jgi:hypothetical protein
MLLRYSGDGESKGCRGRARRKARSRNLALPTVRGHRLLSLYRKEDGNAGRVLLQWQNWDQREHPRRNLRFRPSMKDSVSKLGCEIRRGATLETRIFNENPHIRLKKPYLWLKYQCISLKNSECQNDRFLPHFQPGS